MAKNTRTPENRFKIAPLRIVGKHTAGFPPSKSIVFALAIAPPLTLSTTPIPAFESIHRNVTYLSYRVDDAFPILVDAPSDTGSAQIAIRPAKPHISKKD